MGRELIAKKVDPRLIKRARCDCGHTLSRVVSVNMTTKRFKEEAVHCSKCKQYMRRVKAMDAEEFIDIPDPRPRLRIEAAERLATIRRQPRG